jgi:phage shock protein B
LTLTWFVLTLLIAIPLLLVVGVVVIGILLVLRIGSSARDKRLEEQEARTMQELYQGMEKMEKRVEALETILLDRERKDAPQ